MTLGDDFVLIMAPKGWASADELVFLEVRLGSFYEHQKKGTLQTFWDLVCPAFLQSFSEELKIYGAVPDLSVPLYSEHAVLRAGVLRATIEKRKQAVEVYSRMYYKTRVKDSMRDQIKSHNLTRSEVLEVIKKVTGEKFEGETAEVRAEIFAEVEHLKVAVEEKKGTDSEMQESSHTNSQMVIDDLPTILKQFFDELCLHSGFKFSVVCCRPVPEAGGDLQVLFRVDQNVHNFGQCYSEYDKMCEKGFRRFIKNVYPPNIHLARALNSPKPANEEDSDEPDITAMTVADLEALDNTLNNEDGELGIVGALASGRTTSDNIVCRHATPVSTQVPARASSVNDTSVMVIHSVASSLVVSSAANNPQVLPWDPDFDWTGIHLPSTSSSAGELIPDLEPPAGDWNFAGLDLSAYGLGLNQASILAPPDVLPVLPTVGLLLPSIGGVMPTLMDFPLAPAAGGAALAAEPVLFVPFLPPIIPTDATHAADTALVTPFPQSDAQVESAVEPAPDLLVARSSPSPSLIEQSIKETVATTVAPATTDFVVPALSSSPPRSSLFSSPISQSSPGSLIEQPIEETAAMIVAPATTNFIAPPPSASPPRSSSLILSPISPTSSAPSEPVQSPVDKSASSVPVKGKSVVKPRGRPRRKAKQKDQGISETPVMHIQEGPAEVPPNVSMSDRPSRVRKVPAPPDSI
ncbi:hypothetical protein BKA93DRAFT_828821 [Sparassis latifolia]